MSGLSEQERDRGKTGYINGVAVTLMFTEADVEAIVAARVAAAREEAATKVEAWGNRWEARAGDYRAPIDSIMRAHASRLHDLAADIRKGADRA